MAQASAELIAAVTVLRKAAEAELNGNMFYQAETQIAALFEAISGGQGVPTAEGKSAASLSDALANLRKLAGKELTDNPFYRVSIGIDELSSLLSGPPAEGQPLPGKPMKSFDELAAASTARLDRVAADLGIRSKPISDEILERRSSEPCAMAELAPPLGADVKAGSREQASPSSVKAPMQKASSRSLFGWLLHRLFGGRS